MTTAWKLIEKPRTVQVTPALLNEFEGLGKLARDRDYKPLRLEIYRRILAAGEFRSVTWASAKCAEDGEEYRANGKHTARVLKEHLEKHGKLPEFYVTVERYECPTLDDVSRLYATFDSKLCSRSQRDINHAFASNCPDLAGVSAHVIDLTVSAAAFHKWNEAELRSVTAPDRAELLLEEVNFATWLQGLIPKSGENGGGMLVGSSKPLLRGPIVCAMLATFRKAPKLSSDFWLAVRDENEPEKSHPTRVLNKYLCAVAVANGAVRATTKKIVGSREIYAKCLHAWNAWRKGETTNLNYYPAAPLPTAK